MATFLLTDKTSFFLVHDFFSCSKNIFLIARKKFLCQEKKSWAKKKNVLSLYQEEFSWRRKKNM